MELVAGGVVGDEVNLKIELLMLAAQCSELRHLRCRVIARVGVCGTYRNHQQTIGETYKRYFNLSRYDCSALYCVRCLISLKVPLH